MKETYVITKKIVLPNGKEQNIILMNGDEVWEFDDHNTAKQLATVMTQNSDSGWIYTAKKIG
jgi:hypothetical protein